MLNSEHYHDPTASLAINEVAKHQPADGMRFYSTPAYVAGSLPSRTPPYKTIRVEEMDMTELKPYINSCAKSKMNPMTCIDCNPGCVFGRRAIELMEQATNPTEPKKMTKAAITNQQKSIREYQAAIASGNVLKYAFEHAKSPDPKRAKAAAAARVAFWRKNYGALIKETPSHIPAEVPDVNQADESKEEIPHLMQMPCLSKKVAAERKAAVRETDASTDVAQVFRDKLSTLNDAITKIQAQITELMSDQERIAKQIQTIKDSAEVLGVSI